MNEKQNMQTDAAELRRRAEQRLNEAHKDVDPDADTARRLLHELQVHQIELEMQNEALLQAKAETETALQRYTELYDFAPTGHFILGSDGVISDVNLTATRILKTERIKLIGRQMGDFVAARSQSIFHTFLNKIPGEQAKERCEVELVNAGGDAVYVLVEAATGQTGNVRYLMVIDITERKRLEIELLRRNMMYALLSKVNSAIVRIVDGQVLFDEICRIVSDSGGFCLVFVGIVNEPDQRVVPVATKGEASGDWHNIAVHCRDDLPGGSSPAGIAIREHRHVVVNDFINDANTAPWHDAAIRHGIRSSLSLPIQGGGMRGVVVVCASEQDYFQPDAVGLFLEITRDISFALDKIQVAEQLKRDEVQLRLHAQVFDKSSDGMMITDADNNILMINQAFANLSGYTLDELKGKNPRILKSGKQDHEFYVRMWQALLAVGFWQGEMWDRNKDGTLYPLWATINRVKNSAGEVVSHFAVYGDLNQKNAVEQLDHLQRYDALTGLPNRLLLEDRVAEAINHARQHGRHVAILFINLDRFHAVNDLFGYQTGDKVLQAIAARLSAIIGSRGTLSHYSGDAFVVVLPDISEIGEINPFAEILLTAIPDPLPMGEGNIALTGRIGIAVFPEDGADFAALMKNAGLATLRAREEGRNTYRYFTSALNDQAQRLITVSGELRLALRNNWFVLHYQPQVNILSGEITGCEALVRLNHPEHGMMAPVEFIAIAEETGLIVPIGEWVMLEACRQVRRWHDDGYKDLVMAVNVSPLQFRQSNLVEVIRRALDESGLAPQYLELEFTESALMKNIPSTMELMKKLKELGVLLSIDDFGTGYSSLNYLKQFPLDKLKIDQSFVNNIASDANDAAIVQAVIALARSLGLSTIAEGVETEAQFGYLRTLHCNEIQGYHYSRAVSASEFSVQLKREHVVAAAQSERTLLLVDDEENVLTSLKRILRREGYNILTAASAEEGLELMAKNPVIVVLSDQRMPGMSGVEFLRRVKLMYPETVRMILSGYTEFDTLTDAINKGEIYKFITKPWENEAIIALIREAFLRYELSKRSAE